MTDFISTREAARRLGITRQTIALYLREGRLHGVKLGKEWRIPRQAAPTGEREEPQQAR
jgi:excisionase family DNA binding protein